jgi:hypothetical protein
MFNRTAVAKAFVMAACALAYAFLTIGMGVNSTWAESDQSPVLKFTPVPSRVLFQPATAAGYSHRLISMPRTAHACKPGGGSCDAPEDCCSKVCALGVCSE